MIKRLIILMGLLTAPLAIGLLFTYEIIKIDWISFMEIQPAIQAQREPLPIPVGSVPITGPALIAGVDAPVNPLPGDQASSDRGKVLYDINCKLCHGEAGKGNGQFSGFFKVKPADLTAGAPLTGSDGAIFATITNGVPGTMPPLKENLSVADRWDVVNYVRTLQGK
jgi:mono/diheme cytochrome c family protein